MSQALSNLLALLDLEKIEEGLFRGQSEDLGLRQVFGGQVVGQALYAAKETVPVERLVHSFHSYFLRPGDSQKPIVYDVEVLRDGGFSAVNARSVAKKLGCSAQPIYLSFKSMDELKTALKKYLNGTELYFEEDDLTDKSQRYLVAEIIREKVLLSCDNEIPHGIGVYVNKMQQTEDGTWDIDATILVEKASHKPIVLGKQGAKIKSIGVHARESIEKLMDEHVFLTLWVKVKEEWRNNPSVLNELGYTTKK